MMPELRVGDPVSKPIGYRFDGIVLAVFPNLSGAMRYVVENEDGIIHIFNRNQLATRTLKKENP